MAYLDICDIISERGFWEGDGSGEEVKGMLGFRVLEGLLAGAEELLLGPGGREPASKRETSLVLLPGIVDGEGAQEDQPSLAQT